MNIHTKLQSFMCPCCGGFIGEAAPIAEVLEGVNGGFSRIILDTLAKRQGRFVSRKSLIHAMYGSSIKGGPDSAEQAVNVHIHRLRKKIARFGWTIVCVGRDLSGNGDGGTYKLVPTEAGQ